MIFVVGSANSIIGYLKKQKKLRKKKMHPFKYNALVFVTHALKDMSGKAQFNSEERYIVKKINKCACGKMYVLLGDEYSLLFQVEEAIQQAKFAGHKALFCPLLTLRLEEKDEA